MIPIYRVKAATPILYHITSMRAVAFILTKDRFELKPSEGTSVEEQLSKAAYYLSCSRSKVGSYLLKNDYPGAATLVLDGTALGSRYHIQPVDYWDTLKNQPNDMMRKESYETEDRLMSPKPVIPSASKYITAIHIRKNRDVKASEPKLLFAIKKACLLHKIPVYLYDAEDKQGFRLQDTRKAIPFPLVKPAQEIIEPMDDYHRKYFKDRFRVNSIRPWIELYYTPMLPAEPDERLADTAYRTYKRLSKRAQQKFNSLAYSDAINSFEADLHNAKSIPYDHVSKEREELDRIVVLMRKLKLDPKGFIKLLKDKWHPRY